VVPCVEILSAGKGLIVPLQELPSLSLDRLGMVSKVEPRFSGLSTGSLNCSLRAASKLAALKQSMLLFLSFAEASNASKPIFHSGTATPFASVLG